MPKKSRAARAQQNQRETEKKKVEAVRPLVSSSSALVDNEAGRVAPTSQDTVSRVGIYDAPVVAAPQPPEAPRSAPAARPRGPLPARRFASARQPLISREEEYLFVRSDLRTVLILTVLMIIALVVLTIVIGR